MKIITYANSIDEFENLSNEDYGDIIVFEENSSSIFVHQCGVTEEPKFFSTWDEVLNEFIRK